MGEASDIEQGVFEGEIDDSDMTSFCGIEWISNSPPKNNVKRIQFTACPVFTNHELAEKIYNQIEKSLAVIMPQHFTTAVMEKWQTWMVEH